MSTPAASPAPAIPAPAAPAASRTTLPLLVGLAAAGITWAGFFVTDPTKIALSWLSALVFWTGIAIGMLLLIMIHHIFDAGWSTVLRRQLEHGVAAFKWLAVLFLPLLLLSWFYKPGVLWKWMDPAYDLAAIGGVGTVGEDLLWAKKAGYLDRTFFTIRWVLYFGSWIVLAAIFRRNSFSQDADGDPKWTLSSRKWAAGGLFVAALTLTFAAIDWVKSLEYHWFSTIYGVWYFANSVRAALSILVIIMVVGIAYGPLKGLVQRAHFYDVGKLIHAFTIFWAYISFSQYFLIWNANIPEETFWYNLREVGNWWHIGMLLLFGHFFVPFIYLLFYKNKVMPQRLAAIAVWIATVCLIDVWFNVLPFKKDAFGNPLPFGTTVVWDVLAVVAVGGVCVWAYLKSFGTAKLIPIRDPRIAESLQHRE